MEMELKIQELALEYQKERNQFMQVKPKTKKKIRGFERWIYENHLKKDNIIPSERKFFDFCDYCKEVSFFHCYEYNLAWEFEIQCRCERIRKAEQDKMAERIKHHRDKVANATQLLLFEE